MKIDKKATIQNKKSTEWIKLNNIKSIQIMQQTNAKKDEKNEKVKLFNLKKFANQTVFFQRMLSDDRKKIKRRFKLLLITLIKIQIVFLKKTYITFVNFAIKK